MDNQLPPQPTDCKIKCPFCGDDFDLTELPENFAFEEVQSWNTRGYLCCSLCETPVTELENLEEWSY